MMKLPHRRRFLHLAAGAAALPAISRLARAQAYPSRPVRIMVGFAPAGAQDILARLIGQWLSERLGQTFVIENRPGGGGNIAAEAVVRSTADGYTLLLVGPPNAINATLYEKLNFNFLRDIAPVAGIVRAPSMEHIRTGKLRALAVTTAVRSPALPDVPTVSEFVPGYEASASFGVGAPRSTPADIVEKLNKEINVALADPKMIARFADLGGTALPGSPADFGRLLADETEKWGKVIRALNIKAE